MISTIAFSADPSSQAAGKDIARQVLDGLEENTPSVVVIFASSQHDYPALLKAVNQGCKPEILIGCSSAGEFTTSVFNTNSVSAIALHSDEMMFSAGLAQGIKANRQAAAEALSASLRGKEQFTFPFHSGLILADALSGHTDEIIGLLTELTGMYQFFGGGAGDNANFQKTHVFLGEEAYTDAAVLLEILSKKPLGIGVQHGWEATGEKMRVTASEGMLVKSLNGISALDMFQEFAQQSGQLFDLNNPTPFFLHNILGIESPSGYKLRVPLSLAPEGAISFASDIPEGAVVSFMSIQPEASRLAAEKATQMALSNLRGHKPAAALFFDCVATRLRMGHAFESELKQVQHSLQGIQYAGCNTYGQIARVNGQFSGFHNCTAVVCVLPE